MIVVIIELLGVYSVRRSKMRRYCQWIYNLSQMSSSVRRGKRQSGSIVYWLVLVTAATSALLVSSWLFRDAPPANNRRMSAVADEPAAGADKELKLLAVKVVSSDTVPQASTLGSMGHSTSSASSKSASSESTLQSADTASTKLATEPVTHSVEVRRTAKILEPSGDSESEAPPFEQSADSADERTTIKSVAKTDHPDDLRDEAMQIAYLQRVPERLPAPKPLEETSTAAHANHEPSEQAHEAGSSAPDVEANDIETDGQESKPHEINDELRVVSAELQFLAGSKSITEPMRPILSRVIDILASHDDARVVVAVTTNESGDKKQDVRLSQERGRAIIARLVSNGVDLSRVSLDATNGDSIPENSHVVNVQAWKLSE